MNTFFDVVHTPATMTHAERLLLALAASKTTGGPIVEVGTLFGGSTRILRDSAPAAPLYSIDINRFRVDNFIRADEAEFFHGDARAFAAAHPDISIEMLFIDGDHSFPGVMTDYRSLAPLTRPDATICFHDVNHDHFGVHLLVDTLIRNGNLSEWVQVDEICAGRHVHAEIPPVEVFVRTLLEHAEVHEPSDGFLAWREMTYKNHRPQAYTSVLADFVSDGRSLPEGALVVGRGAKGRFLQRYFGLPDDHAINSDQATRRDLHYYVCSYAQIDIINTLVRKAVPTTHIHVLSDYMYSRLVLDDLLNNAGGALLSFTADPLERAIIRQGLAEQPEHLLRRFHENGFLHRFASKFWFDYDYR